MSNATHTPVTTTRSTAMSREEWIAEGTRRFGLDMMQWKFVCPACGHVQCAQDYKDAGGPVGAVGFSCVGRYLPVKRDAFGTGAGPCNYAGGGLIGLNPLTVDGKRYFDFADVEGGAV